ncbi:PREDICTED: proteoglycan 4-like [Wasmannia auropunctata]|uniref:proteoglycan 4-like n=1 Tax=Wasmannia auropunctata TaxID=64793 RepID=UPI0005EEBE82|nr:PREDICTED: proteoglycan 4-like [Wasmannia auropunctata]
MQGFGAILLQKQKTGWLASIAYFSKATSDAEKNYYSFELETLAIVKAVERFHVYLQGMPFKIVTDCNSLALAMKKTSVGCVRSRSSPSPLSPLPTTPQKPRTPGRPRSPVRRQPPSPRPTAPQKPTPGRPRSPVRRRPLSPLPSTPQQPRTPARPPSPRGEPPATPAQPSSLPAESASLTSPPHRTSSTSTSPRRSPGPSKRSRTPERFRDLRAKRARKSQLPKIRAITSVQRNPILQARLRELFGEDEENSPTEE